MTMISYAQNGEDVVLARAFPDEYSGFYVDIGASDPVVDSVTKYFYDGGWHGINVEPAKLAHDELVKARRRDLNLAVGIGAEPGEIAFYELPREMTGCSTFSEEIAHEYEREGWGATRREVEVMTLAGLCAEHAADQTIDFLKVDVEGNEADVLAGADFERFRPRILVIEATVPGTRTPAHEEWEHLVVDSGYTFTLFDGLNRFYVRREDEELLDTLSVPANTFDEYMPFRCAAWRDEARQADATLAEVKTALLAEMESVRAALDQTRDGLASSQATLRDARTELAATRAALMAKVAEANASLGS